MKTEIKMFNQARILQEIGFARVGQFLDSFADDLKTASLTAPPLEPMTHYYFAEVADFLGTTENLPARLVEAMCAIEGHAERSGVPLATALELWLAGDLGPSSAGTGPEEAGRDGQTQKIEDEDLPSLRSYGKAGEDEVQIRNGKLKSEKEHTGFSFADFAPWPQPVNAAALLDALVAAFKRFIILPKWAAETLALWVVHTYAFQFRDVTTYIGIESPEKRCGKTTLLSVLSELVNRAVVSTNISPSAFFRVIEEASPTLLIDEGDTFLQGNDELKGILNSGYSRKTAFVVRVTNEPAWDRRRLAGESSSCSSSSSSSPAPVEKPNCHTPSPLTHHASRITAPTSLARFSCWCPKAIASIGHLPETLADRCIIIRMQRKTTKEECERLRNLETAELKQECVRFAADHAAAIAAARPELPSSLNDRAADIWEPLLALADLAGGHWPETARQAAVALTAAAQDSNPIASLLLDICLIFTTGKAERMFSRELVESLMLRSSGRAWAEARNGKEISEIWLSRQLRPYSIRPRTLWIGDDQAKGYFLADFRETFHRYVPRHEAQAFLDELSGPDSNTETPD
jgi:hypothetical protein